MAGQYGVKETVEGLKGAVALAKAIKEVTADGAQLADFVALYGKYSSDAAFKAKLDAAVADAGKIPDELNDLDLGDCVELLKGVAEALG